MKMSVNGQKTSYPASAIFFSYFFLQTVCYMGFIKQMVHMVWNNMRCVSHEFLKQQANIEASLRRPRLLSERENYVIQK